MKKIIISFLLILVLLSIGIPSFAVNTEAFNPGNPDMSKLFEKIGPILGVIQVIANAVMLISGVMLAIKYMMSSPNEKASIKQHAQPFIIGAVLIFGSINLLAIVSNFAQGMGK